jgi:hypothetical protein
MDKKDNARAFSGIPVRETIRISGPWTFSAHTSRKDSGGFTKGEGERITAIIDREGNRYQEWDERMDIITGLPQGVRVWRSAADERDFGEYSFSMGSHARVEPHACPVMIEIFRETYIADGGVALISEKDYYLIRVESWAM